MNDVIGKPCPFGVEHDKLTPHACPYQQEINDNEDDEYCRCCEECEQECCWDI